MLPDRVSNPGPLTYESGALPIALRGTATAVVNESPGFEPLKFHCISSVSEDDARAIMKGLRNEAPVRFDKNLASCWTRVCDPKPGPEVIKLFSCSTQLSKKF